MIGKILNTLGTRILSAIASLAIAILISNYLGASGKGEQGLIIATISIIIIVTGIVGPSSLVYHLPRFPVSVLVIPSYIWLIICLSGIYFLLQAVELVPGQYITDTCLLTAILSVTNINLSIILAKQRIKENNLVSIIQISAILVMLFIFFIVLKERTIHSYLLSLYVGYGISMFISFLYAFRTYATFTRESSGIWKKALKSMVFLGFFNQIAIFTQLLSFRFSYYILNYYLGTREVGIYSNGISIAESIWIISRSIALVQNTIIVNSTDEAYSVRLTKNLLWINLFISAMAVIVLVLLPSSVYTAIFGPEFGGIRYIIMALAPGTLFFGIALIIGHYFSATGRHYINAIGSSAGLVVTIALSFVIIPVWGYTGAGILASLSYGVTASIVLFYFLRKADMSIRQLLPAMHEIAGFAGQLRDRGTRRKEKGERRK